MTRVLFLTNNPVSLALRDWIARRADVTTRSGRLTVRDVERSDPDLIVSYSYRHLVSAELLDRYPRRFVNLHVSLLPYNRGADPNVWSFLDDTPKGVTVHEMSPGLDEGDVLLSEALSFDESAETLASSYAALQEAVQGLVRENWPSLVARRLPPTPQRGPGTAHGGAEFASLREALLGEEGWDVPIPLLRRRYESLRGAR